MEALPRTNSQRPPAFACAASKGDFAALEAALNQGMPPPLHRTNPDAPTMALARHFGLRHLQPVPTVAACSTGLATLLAGADRIEHGFTDDALVGAVDRSCSPLALAGFHAMHVLCGPRDPSVSGNGFAPAEGAGFVTLARQGSWQLLAGVRLGEAHHETRCDDATVLAAACAALWEAGPAPNLIVVHGTGTSAGDAFEAQALNAGPWRVCPRVTCKPFIGHALGASSVVELAAALEAPVRCLWKLGMGFGGHVTAVALQRQE
jgi:3-oxoacyl-[acyl-carrier-protein] synthase I